MKHVYLLDDLEDLTPILKRIKSWHRDVRITVVDELNEVFDDKEDEVVVVRSGSGGES